MEVKKYSVLVKLEQHWMHLCSVGKVDASVVAALTRPELKNLTPTEMSFWGFGVSLGSFFTIEASVRCTCDMPKTPLRKVRTLRDIYHTVLLRPVFVATRMPCPK